MKEFINILSVVKSVKTLGPGNRLVIWVQGCPFNCKGCATPEGIPLTVNKMVPIESIANDVINDCTITGITFSGGEPFLQASKISKMIELIKKYRKDLNYISYSGYRYKELVWEEAKAFLKHLDLLIDGRYVQKLNTNVGLRGSTNQRFIFLTDKFIKYKDEFENGQRDIEILIDNNKVQSIGIPNKLINIK